ncbi:type IX secretion system membrane protein PorP/SprF [Flavobacterium agricola]|uniref:Type IX secretion system membrane protein PorP/SprF n=1 Tax=Flavobacterium agricola TaxID=2870839 RepID=A0ABY6M042_9FLAO|nr:type IX secretion system membrane protein PorP/SprF [Flavobacterium agricola]UYW01923.1 type IX secretion system membrane protein PorP/SprF [Flavobacterium agricola]
MKKIIVTISLLTSLFATAQQDAQYTQYMYNTINVNPAYAGSRGALSVFGLHRSQWVGMDGAPTTNTISLNTPLGESRLGLGVSLVSDKIGPTKENNTSVDLSYYIPLNERYKLSFGVKGSLNFLDVDYSKLNIYDPSDPNFQNNIENKLSPNFGAGIYVHSDKSYIGLSVPHMLQTKHYDDNTYSVANERMHMYLMAGHVFDLNYDLQFKPAALVKYVNGSPLQVDVSANFWLYEKLTLGVAYRWDASVSGLAGFQISDQLFIGYAYDAETTRLANYNSGSHEIFLRFEFLNYAKKVITPRFF